MKVNCNRLAVGLLYELPNCKARPSEEGGIEVYAYLAEQLGRQVAVNRR
jgi:hypothetical protein